MNNNTKINKKLKRTDFKTTANYNIQWGQDHTNRANYNEAKVKKINKKNKIAQD
jgi:hypothetical protein